MAKIDTKNCVVMEEVDNHEPDEEEIELYARSIGINPKENPELLYIAHEGVSARVPKGWSVLQVCFFTFAIHSLETSLHSFGVARLPVKASP